MCGYRYLCYSVCTHRVIELNELCPRIQFNAALTPGFDVTPCLETVYKSHSSGTTIPGSYWQLFKGSCRRCLGASANALIEEQALDQYLDMGIYRPVLPPVKEYEERAHRDGTRIFPNNMHPFMRIFPFQILWFRMLGVENQVNNEEKSSRPSFSFRGRFDMYQPANTDAQWRFKFVAPLVDRKPLKEHYIYKNGGLTKFDRDFVLNAVSRRNLLWQVHKARFEVRGMTWDHFYLYAVERWEEVMGPDDGSKAALAYRMNCELRRILNLAPLVVTPNSANESLLRALNAQDTTQQNVQQPIVPGPAALPLSAPNTQPTQINRHQNPYVAREMQANAQSTTYRSPYTALPQPIPQQSHYRGPYTALPQLIPQQSHYRGPYTALPQPIPQQPHYKSPYTALPQPIPQQPHYKSPYGPRLGVMQPLVEYRSPYPPLTTEPQATHGSGPFPDVQMASTQDRAQQQQRTNTQNLHAPSAQTPVKHQSARFSPQTSHAPTLDAPDPCTSKDTLRRSQQTLENSPTVSILPESSARALESEATATPKMPGAHVEGVAADQAQREPIQNVDTMSVPILHAPTSSTPKFSTPLRNRRDTDDFSIAVTDRAAKYPSSLERLLQESISANTSIAKSSVLETSSALPGRCPKSAGASLARRTMGVNVADSSSMKPSPTPVGMAARMGGSEDTKTGGMVGAGAPQPGSKAWLFSRGNQATSARLDAILADQHSSTPQAPPGPQSASDALKFHNYLSRASGSGAEFRPRRVASSLTERLPAAGDDFFEKTPTANPLLLPGISSFGPQTAHPNLQTMTSGHGQAGFPRSQENPWGMAPANLGQQSHYVAPSKRYYIHEEQSSQPNFETPPSAKRQRLAGTGSGMGGPGPVHGYTMAPQEFVPHAQAQPQKSPGEEEK